MTWLASKLGAWLSRRADALEKRAERLREERDCLFDTFDVARRDVVFERAQDGRTDPSATPSPEDVEELDRASEGIRTRMNRCERRMTRLRRRADRYRDLHRRLTRSRSS